MMKLVRGARIVDFGFSSELMAANTHPTRSSDRTKRSGNRTEEANKALRAILSAIPEK
jgi:hypothetical protein